MQIVVMSVAVLNILVFVPPKEVWESPVTFRYECEDQFLLCELIWGKKGLAKWNLIGHVEIWILRFSIRENIFISYSYWVFKSSFSIYY